MKTTTKDKLTKLKIALSKLDKNLVIVLPNYDKGKHNIPLDIYISCINIMFNSNKIKKPTSLVWLNDLHRYCIKNKLYKNLK